MTMPTQRNLSPAVAILLIAWVVAGVVNAGESLMGGTPTWFGVVATVVAVGVWPVVGWFAGQWSIPGFIRLVTVFWVIVVVGTPLVWWPVNATGGETPVTAVLAIVLFALAAPLYGLTAVLPSWEPIVQIMVVGAVVFAVTLGAYSVGLRIGGPSARAAPE